MESIERIVGRVIDGVTGLARRAARVASLILLVVAVVVVGGFLLGVKALSGGMETVWIVLGGAFGLVAVGAALVARWRLGSVRRHVPEIANEVRSLLAQGSDSARTVIETFTVDDDDIDDHRTHGARIAGDEVDVVVVDGSPGTAQAGGRGRRMTMVLGREVFEMRGLVGSGLESSARLSAAVTAFTSFPLLVLIATLISVMFAFLGVIFLIALAL